ncbi:MAG TPA: hypothetical protein VI756_00025 [Blastocatellia bacterium]
MRTTAILTFLGIPALVGAALVVCGGIETMEHLAVGIATNFEPVANYEGLSFFGGACCQPPPEPDILGGIALCLLAACLALLCIDLLIECWEEKHTLGSWRKHGLKRPNTVEPAPIGAELSGPCETGVDSLMQSLLAVAGNADPNSAEDQDRTDLARRRLLNDLYERLSRKRRIFSFIGLIAIVVGAAVTAMDLHRVSQSARFPDLPSHLELVFNTAHSLAFGIFGAGIWMIASSVSFWLRKRHDRLIAEVDDVTISILGAWFRSIANDRMPGKRPPRWLCQPYKSVQIRRRSRAQQAASQTTS